MGCNILGVSSLDDAQPQTSGMNQTIELGSVGHNVR